MTNEEAHAYARGKGVSAPLYRAVRLVLAPLFRIWFRFTVTGQEHIPADGPAIVAGNHKSFSDSFFIALATRRRLRFMAKTELVEGRFGGLLVRLGAFPVRRGESDAEALETAREILRNGHLLNMFPEGTRIRDPERLGDPRKGVARLALETGAPIVPCAIHGTGRLRKGPIVMPRTVAVAFSPAVHPRPHAEPTPEEASRMTAEAVWPQIEQEYGRLHATPGLVAAGLAALGIGAGLAVRRRRRR